MQTDAEPLRCEYLANGLELEFYDLSNRYFGDYHRLHIEVRCRIRLEAAPGPLAGLPENDLDKARELFGEQIEFRRELTRMGVAGADVEPVRARMVDDFMDTTGRYLAGKNFPLQFVLRQLEEQRRKRRFVPGDL